MDHAHFLPQPKGRMNYLPDNLECRLEDFYPRR